MVCENCFWFIRERDIKCNLKKEKPLNCRSYIEDLKYLDLIYLFKDQCGLINDENFFLIFDRPQDKRRKNFYNLSKEERSK